MVDSNDCCGNGCANCILDRVEKLETQNKFIDKRNIIEDYHKFLLITKQPHSTQLDEDDEVIELHFKAIKDASNGDDMVLYVPPGHHLMMRININVHEKKDEAVKHLRPYSPYWFDAERMEFKILVNLKPHGIMSNYLAKLTTEEKELPEFRIHYGSYSHDVLLTKFLVIISQGVAIAPTIPIVEAILHNANDESRIIQLACFQDLRHFYFRQRLYDYAHFWNYCSYIYLAHELCGRDSCQLLGTCTVECDNFLKRLLYKEQVQPNRLNADGLKKVIELKTAVQTNKIIFVISGSRLFQDAMKVIVEDMNLPAKQIHLL